MNQVLRLIKEQIIPYQGNEIVKEILGKYYNLVRNNGIPVVLFCAGFSGKVICDFFNKYDIYPACFCDNNPSRVGTELCGLPIISFDELNENHHDNLVVIASTAFQRFIEEQLVENGFETDRIISLNIKDPSYDQVLKREQIMSLARNGEPEDLLEWLKENEHRIQAAHELLADEKSKALFVRRLALVASGFEYRSYKKYLELFSEPILKFGYDNLERLNFGGNYFYFNNDVLELKADEVFVDGGAYIGDSTDEFVKTSEKIDFKYDKIFCFEADRGNYERLVENTSRYRDLTCLNLGLWSGQATVQFISSENTESFGARIQNQGGNIPVTSDTEIETTSIDKQLIDKKVSLIKLDIEGAELEAIKGAAETIKNHSPKLAISVYHNTSDLFEIPLLINQMKPEYRLYLRHLSNYFDDTMLFASI